MISNSIEFKSFKKKTSVSKIKKIWKSLAYEFSEGNNDLLLSLSKKYKYSFKFSNLKKYKKLKLFQIIGMGGSSLGAQAIYDFLSDKVKKIFLFTNNITPNKNLKIKEKKLNIIISKSGNTLETISNLNSQKIKKNCLFITENRQSYLRNLAYNLQSEVIDHNNFIGGRYSVLSETGMVPAYLMGLDPNKFKQFDNLIKNKKFINCLINNTSSLLKLHNQNKKNSIILNYDESSNDLFYWYQQLVAESLGKRSKGILPIVSSVPKDNHSVMQLYLDGFKDNFFTFFYVKENSTQKIDNSSVLKTHNYLKNKSMSDILFAQFRATQKVFVKKNIPFRTFVIKKRDEKTLGELFTFFILETILLAKAMKINPFDQPAVELIKQETLKILKN